MEATEETSKDKEAIEWLLDFEKETTVSPGNEDGHYRGGEIQCPHCKDFFEIQPFDFIESQELGPHEANIVKYICRWQGKGGVKDLWKIQWYLHKLIRFVTRKERKE